MTTVADTATDLVPVCPLDALLPEQGAAALLPDGTAVAIFRLYDGSLHAVGNLDPALGAPVMCHGIVGDRDGHPTVASPLGKQVFSLLGGHCLDDPALRLPLHKAVVRDGVVHVSPPRAPAAAGGRAS